MYDFIINTGMWASLSSNTHTINY